MSAAMRVLLVAPVGAESTLGNGVTARRWAGLLEELGHEAAVDDAWRGQDCDVLVALHARRSHPAVRAFRAARPGAGLVVALTGTDLYVDLPGDPAARASLRLADRIVALHGGAGPRLPAAARPKLVAIVQSAVPPAVREPARADAFEVSVLAHLRDVKDPLRAALAARRLPVASRVRVVHAGRALDPEWDLAARAEARDNPRYEWLGDQPFEAAQRLLARSRATVLSSRSEGGANVISEAVACGVPIVASRIDSSIALLGADYPALFAVGDDAGLAALLARLEQDAGWRADLAARIAALRPRFSRDAERAAWADLLAALG